MMTLGSYSALHKKVDKDERFFFELSSLGLNMNKYLRFGKLTFFHLTNIARVPPVFQVFSLDAEDIKTYNPCRQGV